MTRPAWIGPLLLTVIGLGMLTWTWGTWPNAFVDFGRELYTAWRISEGDVLYRDIAWFNGPLSAYINALLFQLFGPGLRVLVIANAAGIVLLVAVLHALLRSIADRTAAFVACAAFLVLFAFSRIDAIGNDNWLTPYSHELTHGILLALLALGSFQALRDRPRRASAVSGVLLGFVALTKAEPFVALAPALVCALVLRAFETRGTAVELAREAASQLAILSLAMALPIVSSFLLLSLAMPHGEALLATLGAWPAILASDVGSQYFYRATLGVVDLSGNLTAGLGWAAAWSLAAGGVALGCLRVRPTAGGTNSSDDSQPDSRPRSPIYSGLYYGAAALLCGLATVVLGGWLAAVWPDFVRPLPFFSGLLALGAVIHAARSRDPRIALAASLLVFATLLLAKVLLRVRLDQYGFALAMPGTLLMIAAGTSWLPLWIGHRGGDARLARAAALGIFAALTWSLLPHIDAGIRERQVPIGTGVDAFLTDSEIGPVLNEALAALAEREDGSLVVMPEGVMINYLSRRVNPTGHINFMPPELMIFDEQEILARLQESPPDLLMLTHKDTREYGVGFFGRGYGRSLHSFVASEYREVETFGDRPLHPKSRFGVTLMERVAR